MTRLICEMNKETFLTFAKDLLEGCCEKKHRNSKTFLTIRQFKNWEPLVDVNDCDFSVVVYIDIREPRTRNFDEFMKEMALFDYKIEWLKRYGFREVY